MCKWGDQELCLVPIPAELSHNDKFHWSLKGVDTCLAPVVNALNAAGVYTSNCCCGHGSGEGAIFLHDGRVLVVRDGDEYLAQLNATHDT